MLVSDLHILQRQAMKRSAVFQEALHKLSGDSRRPSSLSMFKHTTRQPPAHVARQRSS
jgi:hypothetical protein